MLLPTMNFRDYNPRQFHRLGRQLGQPFRRNGGIGGFRLGRVAWGLWRKV
jgi:hypothetical protein